VAHWGFLRSRTWRILLWTKLFGHYINTTHSTGHPLSYSFCAICIVKGISVGGVWNPQIKIFNSMRQPILMAFPWSIFEGLHSVVLEDHNLEYFKYEYEEFHHFYLSILKLLSHGSRKAIRKMDSNMGMLPVQTCINLFYPKIVECHRFLWWMWVLRPKLPRSTFWYHSSVHNHWSILKNPLIITWDVHLFLLS
jgi:hypothetical protein